MARKQSKRATQIAVYMFSALVALSLIISLLGPVLFRTPVRPTATFTPTWTPFSTSTRTPTGTPVPTDTPSPSGTPAFGTPASSDTATGTETPDS